MVVTDFSYVRDHHYFSGCRCGNGTWMDVMGEGDG